MTKNEDILLSICIPTFNRIDTLIVVLQRLVDDPDFDKEVEVVISDNCSTDDTEAQIRKLSSEYPNIRYYRNSENIKDKNFYLALSRGHGRYLKLLNDYVLFRTGGLGEMKAHIRKYEGQNVNLYFYSNLRSPYRNSKEVQINNVDSFVRAINNKITWITNFGVWKKHFDELPNDDLLWHTQLSQMDWTLHEVALRQSIIVNFRFYQTLVVPNKKMSYAFFIPHVVNYYGIYQKYVEKGLIYEKTIEYDKYRVLSHFVGSRIIEYLYLEKEVPFDIDIAKNVLNDYFGEIHYYKYLKIKGCFLSLVHKIGLLTVLKSFRKSVFRKWKK